MNELEKRFWSKVKKLEISDCWEWTASKLRGGYGYFFSNGTKQAHRMAYELTFGPIPSGEFVLHKCDNPACCNPSHLFLGSQADNVGDMVSKNRSHAPRGESHPSAKLTTQDVLAIRTAYSTGKTSYPKLAAEYGVTFAQIRNIVKRTSWKWLDK